MPGISAARFRGGVLAAACIAVLLLQVSTAEVVEPYAQCGGTSCQSGACEDKAWPDSQCAKGWFCRRQTEFFWQCQNKAGPFEQCGGLSCTHDDLCGDNGWASCPEGFECVRQSQYYWQCAAPTSAPAEPAASAVITVPSASSVSVAALPAATTTAAVAAVAAASDSAMPRRMAEPKPPKNPAATKAALPKQGQKAGRPKTQPKKGGGGQVKKAAVKAAVVTP